MPRGDDESLGGGFHGQCDGVLYGVEGEGVEVFKAAAGEVTRHGPDEGGVFDPLETNKPADLHGREAEGEAEGRQKGSRGEVEGRFKGGRRE